MAAARQQAPAAPPTLPWLRLPISIPAGSGVPLSAVCGLAPALRAAVADELGFSELFPVQAAVWRGLAGGGSACHDMCVCAPTGSGKTLAYALPLLNHALATRQPGRPQLSGLVVLPTRDLAVQVHAVLSALGRAAGVAIGLAAAQEGVAAEAARLAARPSQPGSGVDVLVATPGRLMAHVQGAGSVLSLAQLRFLVVDEADRLLRQDYQGWLAAVLEHTRGSGGGGGGDSSGGGGAAQPLWQQPGAQAGAPPLQPPPPPPQQQQPCAQLEALGGAGGAGCCCEPPLLPFARHSTRLVKLVVSATLTRDPSKLLRLELHNPRFITLTGVAKRYALPPGLSQHRLVVPAQHKPLALLGLLTRLAGTPTIVFASSLETTHRLALLLAAVPSLAAATAEYSSRLDARARAVTLGAFRVGARSVLVTSDAMARGMDLAGVGAVVNYDPPAYPKAYVHRAGRTARAGARGAVYSLLKPEDVVHFNAMLAKLEGGHGQARALRLLPGELAPLRPELRAALAQVQALLATEAAEAKQAQGQQQQQQHAGQQGQPAGTKRPLT